MKKEKENQESGANVQESETKKKTSGSSSSKKQLAETAENAAAKKEAEEEKVSPAKEETKPEPKKEAEENKEEKKTEVPLCIVIPYLASKSKGEELLYAVRAWAKHLPEARIVIVGDKPQAWAGKELEHIAHKPQSDNPQIDVAHKMAAAIASDLVPDVFIWTNDDIYTVSPIQLADIMVLKAHGKLSKRGTHKGVYQENSLRTAQALKKEGISNPYDYATHTPVVLQKDRLSEILADFKCLEEGHLVYTLYANICFAGHRPIITQNDGRGSIIASVYRANPDQKVLAAAFENRKWINNNDNGWKAVEPKLKELFPDKCRFEK